MAFITSTQQDRQARYDFLHFSDSSDDSDNSEINPWVASGIERRKTTEGFSLSLRDLLPGIRFSDEVVNVTERGSWELCDFRLKTVLERAFHWLRNAFSTLFSKNEETPEEMVLDVLSVDPDANLPPLPVGEALHFWQSHIDNMNAIAKVCKEDLATLQQNKSANVEEITKRRGLLHVHVANLIEFHFARHKDVKDALSVLRDLYKELGPQMTLFPNIIC